MKKEYPKEAYGQWAGNPKGRKYQETNCAHEVYSNYRFYQCSRKRGHGEDGLFCKQHAKKVD